MTDIPRESQKLMGEILHEAECFMLTSKENRLMTPLPAVNLGSLRGHKLN